LLILKKDARFLDLEGRVVSLVVGFCWQFLFEERVAGVGCCFSASLPTLRLLEEAILDFVNQDQKEGF